MSPWRDLAAVVLATLAVAAGVVYFEASETLFASTRQWEHWQLDELPVVLLALAVCLAWFAWRRYREARRELALRRAAEARLSALLLDNRRLAQQYLLAQETERKALARELHDELGQYLNAIKTDAVTLQAAHAAAGGPSRAAAAIVQHTDRMYGIVRDLIRRLRPIALDDLGLRAALEHQLEQWQERLPQVRFTVDLQGDLDGVGEPLALAVYRAVQEGLTNVARHAGATRVALRVTRAADSAGDEVIIELRDDGRGGSEGGAGGLGLIGMRERIESLGGRLRITTAAGCGFALHARIPVSVRGSHR